MSETGMRNRAAGGPVSRADPGAGMGPAYGILPDRDAIRRAFGVSKETVAAWRRAGAPIIRVGRRYQARYDDLWDWLAERAGRGA